MHKIGHYHLSLKKLSILYNLYDKIAASVKSIYPADLIAKISSMLTDILPTSGRYITNALVALVGNILAVRLLQKKALRIAIEAGEPEKTLIISDLNIGDSVNLQAVILAVKTVFPESKVDYAINVKAYNLVACNPYVDDLFNILSYDIAASQNAVNSLINSKQYDLIINLCPFFKKNSLICNAPIIDYKSLSARLIYNELYSDRLNHVAYQAYSHFFELFSQAKEMRKQERQTVFVPSIWLSNHSIAQARRFLAKHKLLHKRPILYNPDATSIYTRIPFDIQLDILKRLCESDLSDPILLTPGHSWLGIHNRLIRVLKEYSKIILIPEDMPIDIYAALIDFCQLFVTADTGTMHIAAAKKFDENGNTLINKTAIYSIFGATSDRIYGYSSLKDNFLSPGQGSPSKLYISDAICKNITCVNKKAKRCRKIRCFDGIRGNKIANDIIEHLVEGR